MKGAEIDTRVSGKDYPFFLSYQLLTYLYSQIFYFLFK